MLPEAYRVRTVMRFALLLCWDEKKADELSGGICSLGISLIGMWHGEMDWTVLI